MRIRVGTSGFSYAAWKGSFYPAGLPESKMLAFYAGTFDTCEINNTFYRMPKPGTLAAWAAQVASARPDFAFAVKAPVYLAHLRKGAALAEPAAAFFAALAELGPRAGPVFLQLHKSLPREGQDLERFLDLVPPGVRIALEAPHPSWQEDASLAALRARGVALVITDSDEGASPLVATAGIVATADFGYVRLRRAKYAPRRLAGWAETIRAQPWRDAWVFFKHEEEGTGPRFGKSFQKLVGSPRG